MTAPQTTIYRNYTVWLADPYGSLTPMPVRAANRRRAGVVAKRAMRHITDTPHRVSRIEDDGR